MKIGIASDHKGFELKSQLIKSLFLPDFDIQWKDLGCASVDRCDYPPLAADLCKKLIAGKIEYGILICGSGVGMSIAANRFAGIYAALVWNEKVATMAKEADNANVLVLPAEFVSFAQAQEIIRDWIEAKFKGGRYKKRLDMIDENKK